LVKFLFKRGGVKWHNCYQRTIHGMWLLNYAFTYWSLLTRKTGQRVVSTSIQLTFQCGVLCKRSCIVRCSKMLIIWSVFC